MERVPMMDCGDNVRRAEVGTGPKPVVKTASYTLQVTDSGKAFTNKGATGDVVFTLPKPFPGATYKFFKQAAHNITLLATNGAKINGGTANKRYADTTNGDVAVVLRITSDGTDWLVEYQTGTWANDNA